MPANALAPEPRNAMLRPYEPTLRERIAAYFMGDTRPSPERRQFATGIADILSYLPGTGNVIQGEEAYRRGDNKGAILAALPIPGAANVAARAEQEAVKRGIRAFHGSPHSFTKFDMSKIGTGEGAQSYGHGLYFAEHEPVAQQYRDALSYPTYRGRRINEIEDPGLQEAVTQIAHDIKFEGMTPEEAIVYNQENLLRRAQHAMQSFKESPPELADLRAGLLRDSVAVAKAARNVKPEYFAPNKGHMYEVNINADPNTFLDYETPFSAQPENVKSVLTKMMLEGDALRADKSSFTGADAMSAANRWANQNRDFLAEKYGSEALYGHVTPIISKELNAAGVPGVKYFDAGSRAASEGTRNYVVFDDKIVEIMRKYGLMGPIGAGIAAKILERQQQRQEM